MIVDKVSSSPILIPLPPSSFLFPVIICAAALRLGLFLSMPVPMPMPMPINREHEHGKHVYPYPRGLVAPLLAGEEWLATEGSPSSSRRPTEAIHTGVPTNMINSHRLRGTLDDVYEAYVTLSEEIVVFNGFLNKLANHARGLDLMASLSTIIPKLRHHNPPPRQTTRTTQMQTKCP
ncbi:hypothetical protein HGRIS_001405 [Hohenbuehelia grisea]|uniref:Uncharacterized protein n=1 Tax=Hohenbuehelia grisea TaxID=104357 RepID=A0ABR3IPF4_9AGAR